MTDTACCQIADALQVARRELRWLLVDSEGRQVVSDRPPERHACGGAPPRVPERSESVTEQACSLVRTVVPCGGESVARRS